MLLNELKLSPCRTESKFIIFFFINIVLLIEPIQIHHDLFYLPLNQLLMCQYYTKIESSHHALLVILILHTTINFVYVFTK